MTEMRWCHGHARLEEGPPWPCFPNVPNPTNDDLYRHDAEERAVAGTSEEFREYVLEKANDIAASIKSSATVVLRTPKGRQEKQDFDFLEKEIRRRFPK